MHDRESTLPWLLLSGGAVLGSWMNLSVALALVRHPSHPDIGWGELGLVCLQPIAMLLAGAGAVGLLFSANVDGRRVAAVVAVLTYIAFAFVGFLFDNSGC